MHAGRAAPAAPASPTLKGTDMGDTVAAEHIVGEHTVHGRSVEVHRITWKNSPGLSYDVADARTGVVLTQEGSFDHYPTAEQLSTVVDEGSTTLPCTAQPPESDGPLTAIWTALTAVHDASLLRIHRTTDPDTYITVTHQPNPNEDVRRTAHAAYTATLQEAGWTQALNAGPMVLIPGIPSADTEPGTYTATWSVTVDGAPDPIHAAYEARGLQHENAVTEAVFTVIDPAGRHHLIITDDERD